MGFLDSLFEALGLGLGRRQRRTAVISDIHGNKQALEAVIAQIKAEGITDIICLGDILGLGQHPNETVALLRDLEKYVLLRG